MCRSLTAMITTLILKYNRARIINNTGYATESKHDAARNKCSLSWHWMLNIITNFSEVNFVAIFCHFIQNSPSLSCWRNSYYYKINIGLYATLYYAHLYVNYLWTKCFKNCKIKCLKRWRSNIENKSGLLFFPRHGVVYVYMASAAILEERCLLQP